ncbi:MAG: Lrp/AsnC family transcriptional regulator [Pseudomonadota bacterium]
MMPLDIADKKLLNAVQQEARLTADQLSEICGLSPTAALKRFKKLRSDGVIQREVAVVAPKAVGLSVMVIALVSLERESKDVIDRFKKSIQSSPEIMQGYYITGDADFVLTITAKSMDEYEQFTRDFLYDQHRVKNFKTLVVLDAVKTGSTVPVD